MPAKRLSDEQNNELVRAAIAEAESAATSDAEFAQILRAVYLRSHPVMSRALPVMRVRSRRGAAAAPEQDPDFHIYEDARFLQNARAMAARVKARLRIMGGTTVPPTDFPDCVAVGRMKGSTGDWQCTGTLIAPNVVVTACHCQKTATHVHFGNDVAKKGTRIAVKDAVRHPGYARSKEERDDLMVLVLEKKSTVKPRAIADSRAIDAATDGRAVGFGNVDASGSIGYGIKRMVDIPIASTACRGRVKGRGTDAKIYGCNRGLELVAGKPMMAKDSCSGDSGGPFYIPSGKTWLLAGATSRATTSAIATCGDGGIYIRLDQYREWIEDVAKVKLV
ncbi:MAG: trypsin-like serine protease [Gemmatimonadaceae bacterium]|nr:trypsin-like serine protease [Gemmatimonadaceae bacterium]